MSVEAFQIEVTVARKPGAQLLVPVGIETPQSCIARLDVAGGVQRSVMEHNTGQKLLLVAPDADQIRFTYHFLEVGGSYPEAMFVPHDSRFTRAAEGLLDEVSEIAPDATGLERARAIACATAEKFTYGHPEDRFTDGLDHVPAIGCGLTEGSCTDINTYFIASLRAAGFETGYVVGYFFPAEKVDHCEDMHCWVATRIGGETQEWDIAHHLKLGTRDIHPGLNPKPGFRAAVGHSMGLTVHELGFEDVKLLCEPTWLLPDGTGDRADLEIRLKHPALQPV